jgi:hypothetical protein
MTYEEFKAQRDALEEARNSESATLQAFPKLPNGMHPDEVKFSPEYREQVKRFRTAQSNLQRFNGAHVKQFSKEIRADRDKARAAKLNV